MKRWLLKVRNQNMLVKSVDNGKSTNQMIEQGSGELSQLMSYLTRFRVHMHMHDHTHIHIYYVPMNDRVQFQWS